MDGGEPTTREVRFHLPARATLVARHSGKPLEEGDEELEATGQGVLWGRARF